MGFPLILFTGLFYKSFLPVRVPSETGFVFLPVSLDNPVYCPVDMNVKRLFRHSLMLSYIYFHVPEHLLLHNVELHGGLLTGVNQLVLIHVGA